MQHLSIDVFSVQTEKSRHTTRENVDPEFAAERFPSKQATSIVIQGINPSALGAKKATLVKGMR